MTARTQTQRLLRPDGTIQEFTVRIVHGGQPAKVTREVYRQYREREAAQPRQQAPRSAPAEANKKQPRK